MVNRRRHLHQVYRLLHPSYSLFNSLQHCFPQLFRPPQVYDQNSPARIGRMIIADPWDDEIGVIDTRQLAANVDHLGDTAGM